MIVDLPDQVTGYLDEEMVVLTCEVHGFLRSTDPPAWLNNNGSPIDTTSPLKYQVNTNRLTSQVSFLIPNGSVVSGLRSTLIIKQLEEGDEGQYICMVEGNFSVATLLIQKCSITTPNPCKFIIVIGVIIIIGLLIILVNEQNCTQSIVVASFVSSLITAVIVITISIAIYAGVWLYRKSHPLNEVPGHGAAQGSSNEDVYEIVEDKAAAMEMSMMANEAYGTTTTTAT